MLRKIGSVAAVALLSMALAVPALAKPKEDKPKKEKSKQAVTSAEFSADGLSVTAQSDKDLGNVVLAFCDGSHQKFDDLNGHSQTLAGTGTNQGKELNGAWIKSGNNKSGDGPGYGAWHERAGACEPPPDEIGDDEGDAGEDPSDEVCVIVDDVEVCFTPDDPDDPIIFW